MEQKSRLVESHDQAIRRLAVVAEERGITIHWHDRGAIREYYATSNTSPGLLHRVTLFSCSCEGFIRHGRCTHHARLLAELDELPPLPPAPSAAEMTERRAQRVFAQHARHIEEQARKWLTSLIEKQERGEIVAQADIREATEAVATYAAIASPPVLVALAA